MSHPPDSRPFVNIREHWPTKLPSYILSWMQRFCSTDDSKQNQKHFTEWTKKKKTPFKTPFISSECFCVRYPMDVNQWHLAFIRPKCVTTMVLLNALAGRRRWYCCCCWWWLAPVNHKHNYKIRKFPKRLRIYALAVTSRMRRAKFILEACTRMEWSGSNICLRVFVSFLFFWVFCCSVLLTDVYALSKAVSYRPFMRRALVIFHWPALFVLALAHRITYFSHIDKKVSSPISSNSKVTQSSMDTP